MSRSKKKDYIADKINTTVWCRVQGDNSLAYTTLSDQNLCCWDGPRLPIGMSYRIKHSETTLKPACYLLKDKIVEPKSIIAARARTNGQWGYEPAPCWSKQRIASRLGKQSSKQVNAFALDPLQHPLRLMEILCEAKENSTIYAHDLLIGKLVVASFEPVTWSNSFLWLNRLSCMPR